MIFSNKLLLAGATLAIATAAGFPSQLGDRYLGTYQQDIRKREALRMCEKNPEFVRFLASNREQCFDQLRLVGMPSVYSGVWSKPDRAHIMADN